MSRKNNACTVRSRKNICGQSKLNHPAKTLTFDQWKPQMPQWLKDAETAIESGHKEEAAEILNPQRIEAVLKQKAGPERTFTIYGIALLLHKFGKSEEAENSIQGTAKNISPSGCLQRACGYMRENRSLG